MSFRRFHWSLSATSPQSDMWWGVGLPLARTQSSLSGRLVCFPNIKGLGSDWR